MSTVLIAPNKLYYHHNDIRIYLSESRSESTFRTDHQILNVIKMFTFVKLSHVRSEL